MSRSLPITSAAVALALAGCGKQSVLAPAGPGAASLARLGWFALLSLSAIAVIVLVLIVWASMRRRGTLEEHAPIDDPGDTRWIVIGGLFVPAIVLAILFVMTLRGMDAFPLHDGEHRAADLRKSSASNGGGRSSTSARRRARTSGPRTRSTFRSGSRSSSSSSPPT